MIFSTKHMKYLKLKLSRYEKDILISLQNYLFTVLFNEIIFN